MPTPLLQPQNSFTVKSRVKKAADFIQQLTGSTGDYVYLTIGRNYPWSANDTLIPQIVETTDVLNQYHRDIVALKLLSVSSASLVVRRNDWVANTYVYDPFHESIPMYSYIDVNVANGTVNVSNTSDIIGTNTTFQLDYMAGDIINITGDGIYTLPQQKEVINVISQIEMTVNTAVTGNYVSSNIENWSNTYPNYSYNFYVRNIYDQVFICLDNNNGAVSNAMPQLSVGGQLPGDPYIITSDGYKWKYMYTMSAGQKKLFLNQDWMPIGSDPLVLSSATDGRIDIVDIISGGSGYNSNSAACNAPILVLTGDGSGANLSAQIDSNGTIIGVNILNGGSGYTIANLSANTGVNGAGAIFNVSVGPRGGWGSNAAMQLGATTLMISTTLSDTESGTIPVVQTSAQAGTQYFNYRQIGLLLNPTTYGSSNVANSTNYDATTVIQVSSNPGFAIGDYAYQNQGNGLLQNATFVGTVVWYDSSTNELHLNNIGGIGNFAPQTPIYGVVSNTQVQNNAPYVTATAFSLSTPPINTFSGTDLYIENISPIQRFPLQTEEIRLIVSF